MVVTLSLGPSTAWATTGGPPPPASCFQADASGDYPTCALVHGTWVRGGDVAAHDQLASDAIVGATGLLLLGLMLALARAGARRLHPRVIEQPE